MAREVVKKDEVAKFEFIILLCAASITKSIKELYENSLKDGNLELASGSVLFKWSTVFLESIYFYSYKLNLPNEFESDLFGLLANVFFMASPDNERRQVEKDMVNGCLKRKNEYKNYKGDAGPPHLYGKVIAESAGFGLNALFIVLISNLSIKRLNLYMSFYEADIRGKEVDLGKIVETL